MSQFAVLEQLAVTCWRVTGWWWMMSGGHWRACWPTTRCTATCCVGRPASRRRDSATGCMSTASTSRSPTPTDASLPRPRSPAAAVSPTTTTGRPPTPTGTGVMLPSAGASRPALCPNRPFPTTYLASHGQRTAAEVEVEVVDVEHGVSGGRQAGVAPPRGTTGRSISAANLHCYGKWFCLN